MASRRDVLRLGASSVLAGGLAGVAPSGAWGDSRGEFRRGGRKGVRTPNGVTERGRIGLSPK